MSELQIIVLLTFGITKCFIDRSCFILEGKKIQWWMNGI